MTRRGAWMLFFVAALLPSMGWGQADSVFQILDHGQAVGCGTVVETVPGGGVGLGLTAWHVLSSDPDGPGPQAAAHENAGDVPRFGIRYQNGRLAKDCWCVRHDADRDMALIQVWVPPDVPAIEAGTLGDLFSSDPTTLVGKYGTAIELKPISLVQSRYLFFDGQLVPGDSGGGVFSNGKLVGVISGGWFWCERETVFEPSTTWPVRAGRVEGFFKQESTGE